ncbi:MAG TPA: 2-phosphosulfolactate phosphatase, partial [Thermotoga sp.]|nr:2-phosphosulfolactate phosphatase [Thermotoga sp.]
SGTNGKFSLEDFLLSGLIVKLLNRKDIDDASKVAMHYYESVENVESEIRKSSHAQRLINLGFEKDIIFCSQIDLFNTVPILKNDAFIATSPD